MLEVSNLTVSLNKLDGTTQTEKGAVRVAVQHRLHLAPDDITSTEIKRRSIDARKKTNVHMIYTVRVTLRGGISAEDALLAKLARRHDDKNIRQITDSPVLLPTRPKGVLDSRPVVVGAGCAGLFCALALANAGLEPILVERGDDAKRRSEVVEHFNKTGELDPESNIQFGCGGAGTFSDGKLTTGTKSPLHSLILDTFVEAGASPDIAYDAKPHIGSDVLPHVVDTICKRITELGGSVYMRTRLVDIETAAGFPSLYSSDAAADGRNQHIVAAKLLRTNENGIVIEERIPTSTLVIACGHSARDVFSLLKEKNIVLERKTFAMGVRIEHLQCDIDYAQYGPSSGHPALGAAPYKLVSHLPSGRSAFSFCMCPGGYVVAAANEAEGVVTNGMSLSSRSGTNANSGLLANVLPEDLPGSDVLEGIYLQRTCEQKAYELGGGGFVAPAQLVGDFLHKQSSSSAGSISPTYPRGVTWGSIEACLPSYISDTLRAAIPDMAKHLRGFDAADAVLTGIESRSSSPVRITRGKDFQSISHAGLYPTGEGAGYAGGIMSAATDGLRVAQAIIDSLNV